MRYGVFHAAFARYAYINSFGDNTKITSTNVTSSATASLKSSYQATIKILLEVSTDGGKTYKTDSTISSKTSTGTSISTNGSKSSLNSNYNYRVKITLTVFDASGYELDGDMAT